MPSMKDGKFSQAQHNAMEAAAHGDSNIGIPKKVGQDFVAADAGMGKARVKAVKAARKPKMPMGGMGY